MRPSVMLGVLGPTMGVPGNQLYSAAFGPGFLLAGSYIGYTMIRSFLNPKLGPPMTHEERATAYKEMTTDDQIGTVTLVGAGMKSEPGVAAKMFRVLAAEGINLQMIDTSTIRITVVIDRREVERAVRALHDAFDLAGEAVRRADV